QFFGLNPLDAFSQVVNVARAIDHTERPVTVRETVAMLFQPVHKIRAVFALAEYLGDFRLDVVWIKPAALAAPSLPRFRAAFRSRGAWFPVQ
ncbi:MAG: hypothetical protein JO028_05705, partial [Acidobacteriaceae bacterium]|nr:hypothetical protein [Acidobacteriaceae bacterium]